MARKTETRVIGEKTFQITQLRNADALDGYDRAQAFMGRLIGGAAKCTDEDRAWLRLKFGECTKRVQLQTMSDETTREIVQPLNVDQDFEGIAEIVEWMIACCVFTYSDFMIAPPTSPAKSEADPARP